jgi:hypothetical protein
MPNLDLRLLPALFLIAHGLIHAAVWLSPARPAAATPFDPAHSWLLDRAGPAMRSSTASRVFALAAAAGFAASGWLLLLNVSGWKATALLGCELGLLLKVVWFNRWLLLGIAIDVAVAALIIAA